MLVLVREKFQTLAVVYYKGGATEEELNAHTRKRT